MILLVRMPEVLIGWGTPVSHKLRMWPLLITQQSVTVTPETRAARAGCEDGVARARRRGGGVGGFGNLSYAGRDPHRSDQRSVLGLWLLARGRTGRTA
jgi:hypothetical protein